MKRSELFFSAILIPLDIIAIFIGFASAYYIRKHIVPIEIIYIPHLYDYLYFISYFMPAWILVFSFFGLYNVKNTKKIGFNFYHTLLAVPTALMLFVTTIFFIKESFFSRLIILYSIPTIILSVFLLRCFVLLIRRFLFRYGIGVKRVLIIGTTPASHDIICDIEKHPSKGFRIIGVVTTSGQNYIGAKKYKAEIIGDIKNLGPIVVRTNPDEIFQTDFSVRTEENLNIIHLCEDKHITFRYIPSLFSLYSRNIDSDTFGKTPIFEVKRSNLDGWGRIAKRIIDIFGALAGIIISLPVQLVIALLIKITDPGPIFFIQERVGRDRNFNFIKYRTMKLKYCTGSKYGGKEAEKLREELVKTKNESSGPMFKMKDDPRVSKIGKFLRKTSLDEIPQFYNILKGEMSIVGPRPPLPGEVAKYTREEMKRIIGVKPGITGMWQVSGRSDIQFEEWVALDKYYIENWSIFLDFAIILKTIWVVVFRKGAY